MSRKLMDVDNGCDYGSLEEIISLLSKEDVALLQEEEFFEVEDKELKLLILNSLGHGLWFYYKDQLKTEVL